MTIIKCSAFSYIKPFIFKRGIGKTDTKREDTRLIGGGFGKKDENIGGYQWEISSFDYVRARGRGLGRKLN